MLAGDLLLSYTLKLKAIGFAETSVTSTGLYGVKYKGHTTRKLHSLSYIWYTVHHFVLNFVEI
jgi:hypothetical protein